MQRINNTVTYTNTQTVCFGGTYTIGSNTYNATGTYTDTFTAANGCDSVVTTVLTVLSQFTTSIAPAGPVTVCNGVTTTLSLVGASNPNFSYQWNDANGTISGATSTSYSVSSAGTYNLTVVNGNGCSATSNSVTVNVITVSTPGSLSTSNVLLDRATMNWGAVANANHYDLRFRQQGTNTWQVSK